MKISIAVPAYEYDGRGIEFLDDLLRTIQIQTFKDFEVVISDHSLNDDLIEVINEFKHKFKIVYVKNDKFRGNSPANTNNAIKNCSGEIIKVMFQDDFFYDDESLQKIHDCFGENVKWLLCGSNHTKDDGYNFYWDLYPKWNDAIIKGINTVGSPSSLSFKKEVFKEVKFDENLFMMMDCDFYYFLKWEYGDPFYLNDILITNRVHKNQISQKFYVDNSNGEKMENEIVYCLNKINSYLLK